LHLLLVVLLLLAAEAVVCTEKVPPSVQKLELVARFRCFYFSVAAVPAAFYGLSSSQDSLRPLVYLM